MTYRLPAKKCIAAFDIDCQNTFTPVCPEELPVAGGDQIVPELNAQAHFASLRLASRDAHSPRALWLADAAHPPLSPVTGHANLDLYWPAHAIVGTKGFEFIAGLNPRQYAYQVYKGVEIDKHPYGACYQDLANKESTGAIEFLRQHGITTVICGGLATDYCVLNTVLQLREAGFDVILNEAACRGIAADTTKAALEKMAAAGVQLVKNAAALAQL
jgi:nicotinamidase/pyrazinamidase